MNDTFKIVIPAEITKSTDGEWKVAGLASSGSIDKQGEIIKQEGIDTTPIAQGKGFFNFDHDNSPENTVGVLDGYQKSSAGLYVSGRLFKNHSRAKALYEIMTSLHKTDQGRVGMSVEGKVLERDSANPSIIKRCIIKNVALTLNPVNQDTFADLVKSMSTAESEVEFDSTGKKDSAIPVDASIQKSDEPSFTASQVVSIVEKALAIGQGQALAPQDRKGGDALGQEELDKKKAKKKLKSINKSMAKSQMLDLMDKLQVLYPNYSRSQIWSAVSDRMQTTFPELDVFKTK